MTNDDKAFVKMGNRIIALQEENERLCEALREIARERSVPYSTDYEAQADAWREHCRERGSIARAALGEQQ